MLMRVVAGLVFCVGELAACMCGPVKTSAKGAWLASRAVFAGTVVLAHAHTEPGGPQQQLVRIRADEAFKGLKAGEAVELRQSEDSCSPHFETGERFVFYLRRSTESGEWYLPPCEHPLAEVEDGNDDLLFLRGLPKSAVGTRLSGTVRSGVTSKRPRGLAKQRIMITSPDGSKRQVKTNAAGAWEIYGLPPGRYAVQLRGRAARRQTFAIIEGSAPASDDPQAVHLPLDGGVSVLLLLPDKL